MDVSPFFSDNSLRFSFTGDGVSVDPATEIVTIAAAALLSGVSVQVTASNSDGAAATGFRLTVTADAPTDPAVVAPVALAAPAPAVFAIVAGTRTISAQAFFSGSDLIYALDAAPAGVTINPGSGLLRIPTSAALETTLVIRATNAAGAATQSLALSVRTTAPATAPAPAAAASGDWTLDQILVLK